MGCAAWWTRPTGPASPSCSMWCTTTSARKGTISASSVPTSATGTAPPGAKDSTSTGPDSDEVRRYLVDNAVYWIEEFHLDGLRLDAADRIVDLSPIHLAEEIGDAVHRRGEALGRPTVVIAEIDSNDPRWVRSRETGGFGLDGHWSDDFHHAVHVALTGERGGYYADFGGVVR